MRDYSLGDLVSLSGYSARGIRHYIQLGLLSRPTVAARATRYPRETLGRLAAIRAWRDEGVRVHRVKRALKALPPDELEAWANQLDPDPATLPPQPPPPLAIAPPVPVAPSLPPLVTAERWVRVPLAPGLELMMREGAGEDVVRLAQEFQARYRATVRT